MIDKLDLRLPPRTVFRGEVQDYVRSTWLDRLTYRGGASRYYRSVTDLRPIGIGALLHRELKSERTRLHGSHKLELIGVGSKNFSDWNREIESVIADNPDSLEVMRLDTCADLSDVPVSRFFDQMRVKFKRSNQGIGDSQWRTISADTIQTLTAGTRPNFVRVYDKTAERNQEYRRIRRRSPAIPSFETLYGHARNAVISRVERQHSARGVPSMLQRFADLHRAADYNPFTNLEIVESVDSLDFASIPDLSVSEALTAAGYAAMRQKLGAGVTARWYNKRSGGNLSRFRQKYAFLFHAEDETGLLQKVVTEYRDSTIQQLSA